MNVAGRWNERGLSKIAQGHDSHDGDDLRQQLCHDVFGWARHDSAEQEAESETA